MTLPAKPEPRDVPIGLIDEPENMARLGFDPDKLEELAADIRRRGIVQRLLMFQKGDRYEIVAGHRRFLAGKMAGLAVVPADVYPTKEIALEGIKYAENRFRDDMSAAEEAHFFDSLFRGAAAGDVDTVCQIVGESREYVETRLLLFNGCPEVFDALVQKKIKLGVAIEINRVTDARVRRAILVDAIAHGATVAIVRGQVTEWKRDVERGSAPLPAPGETTPATTYEQPDFFTCYVCGGKEHPGSMIPVNVHQHCKLAILDKLLRGDSAAT